ncbi:hypothetical protein [Streptomyces leeuwenhoekii]|uniref:Sle1_050 protein n=1 Tax=Streptomyces leeuwenhoekii TaxID=1437453 RepID=A0A0F7VPB3_STRLW|nr:hypothetical protein [Streptomyces leeuwenhoekii]CQR59217.1 sle1_050 [Streptomyces leeuwenhoekii]
MSQQTDADTTDHRFVVRELGPRCFVVDDTITALSYDMRFTREAAQRAADRRNA